MSLRFKEAGHIYESDENIKWLSVTSLIGMFKPKFDAKAAAKKSSTNKKSKWYNMTVEEILQAWEDEKQRSITLGNWYHNQREKDILEFETIEKYGVNLPIIKPIIEEGIKIAPNQKLSEGVYPEHMVYLKSVGICGQADLVEIANGKINITDYKTNKEITETGYTNWEGVTSKLYSPVSHLDDCHLSHYNLQLSIYAYIIKKHNPTLEIGELKIQHVKFKQAGTNDKGYPINELENGEPIIEEIKVYQLPYLKEEVFALMNWLKDNK